MAHFWSTELGNVLVLTQVLHDTCFIGYDHNKPDVSNYEVEIITNQCINLDLPLTTGKTREILFSTRCSRPDCPALFLNGSMISISESVLEN